MLLVSLSILILGVGRDGFWNVVVEMLRRLHNGVWKRWSVRFFPPSLIFAFLLFSYFAVLLFFFFLFMIDVIDMSMSYEYDPGRIYGEQCEL